MNDPTNSTLRLLVRREMRAEVQARLDQDGAADMPACADVVADRLYTNPTVATQIKALLRSYAYEAGTQIVATAGDLPITNAPTPAAPFPAPTPAAPKRSRRFQWIFDLVVYTGETYKRFLACTREELLTAAQRAETRAKTEGSNADFYRATAAQLAAGEVVEKRLTAEAIAQIRAGLEPPQAAAGD